MYGYDIPLFLEKINFRGLWLGIPAPVFRHKRRPAFAALVSGVL
jgi:hypothetical protein